MQAFKDYLSRFPGYTDAIYHEVQPYLSVRQIRQGDYFLKEGQICREIGLVENGIIRLYYTLDGKEITTCFCKENDLTCAYRSMVTSQPSDVTAQAVEDSTLIILPYRSLLDLYSKNSFWQQVGRLATENEYLMTECHSRFLNDLSATERYLEILGNDHELLQRIPLQHLASYLQISPETLSRIRHSIARN
jgi:CRP-like cAMP-binding protein